MKLLVLEDDPALGPELVRGLRGAGFAVDHVTTLADAELALHVGAFECFIADRMVGDGDALTLVESLRSTSNGIPTLILTALGTVDDRVTGFEAGADDYLAKPFAFVELVARVRALSRRSGTARAPILTSGDVLMDVPRHRVSRGGVLLALTAKEFAVLEVLLNARGSVVSRTQLIEACWDELSDPMSNVVDVAIAQLRRRLGLPDLITTVRGVGYRLEAQP